MDKNNEQKSNKTPENKQKQDGMKPWLKLLPAAAVFAAVCVTCYQADKTPVESVQVADNNIMSTDDIKKMISTEFGAICGEMEGGAIGHTCAANNVPFAVLRSISDGGNENAQLDYPTFKKIAAEISMAIILEFIKLQKNQYSLF